MLKSSCFFIFFLDCIFDLLFCDSIEFHNLLGDLEDISEFVLYIFDIVFCSKFFGLFDQFLFELSFEFFRSCYVILCCASTGFYLFYNPISDKFIV